MDLLLGIFPHAMFDNLFECLGNAEERPAGPFTGNFNPVLKPPNFSVCVVDHHSGFLARQRRYEERLLYAVQAAPLV